jgi:hypothetical protein
MAPGNCDRSGSRKAGLNGIRVGCVSGYQFIGLSKTAQNTYSIIESSPALGDANATTWQNCQHRCRTTARRPGARSYSEGNRAARHVCGLQRTLNDQGLKSRHIRATSRFSLRGPRIDCPHTPLSPRVTNCSRTTKAVRASQTQEADVRATRSEGLLRRSCGLVQRL